MSDALRYQKSIAGIIERLPQIPFNIQQVSAAVQREDMDAQKLGQILSKDASLAAKILKTVNSAAFGLMRTVSDISWAVTILGLQGVRDTLLSKTSFSLLTAGKTISPLQKKHFVNVAEVGTKICGLIHRKDISGELYASGLVHDFGEVLFEQAGCSMQAPKLGLDHGEYGARLLEKWNFPEILVMMVRFHHKPVRAPENFRFHTHVLYIAEMICSAKPGAPPDDPYLEQAKEFIKLAEKNYQKLLT
ncbi:HDOD domain-containing protein [Candidatus Riflebacteria bacterium]